MSGVTKRGNKHDTMDEPLDDQEQQIVLEQLNSRNNDTNNKFKWGITAIALCGAFFKLYYGTNQLFWPWHLLPHGELAGQVPSLVIVFWEYVSAFNFLLSAFISNPYFGFQSDRHKLLLSYTPFVIFCFSFATWIVFYGLVIDYYLVWFIGGNVIVEAAARYIAHIISDSEEQMKSLATYMYSHKKV